MFIDEEEKKLNKEKETSMLSFGISLWYHHKLPVLHNYNCTLLDCASASQYLDTLYYLLGYYLCDYCG